MRWKLPQHREHIGRPSLSLRRRTRLSHRGHRKKLQQPPLGKRRCSSCTSRLSSIAPKPILGGLGLIGVGYRGQDWIESQTDAAGNVRVGAGFITWRLQMSPELLDVALARRPSAICLSFGDPQPFAKKVHAANVPLICQVQSFSHARRAAEVAPRLSLRKERRLAVVAVRAASRRWCLRLLIFSQSRVPTRCSAPPAGSLTGKDLQPL